MKKLNKKGFTLVELLAVIVILAVIMVITIPTVLGSMSGAKQSAFNSAVKTIEEYLEKQIDACRIGNNTIASYESSLFVAGSCKLTASNGSNIISKAGYKTTDIATITYNADTGKITAATAGGTGQFSGSTAYSAS